MAITVIVERVVNPVKARMLNELLLKWACEGAEEKEPEKGEEN